jgi:hypothetical protein
MAWLSVFRSRRMAVPFADRVVEAIGWPGYFAVCAAMVLPGLALVGPATRIAERGQAVRAAGSATGA